ncbi:hypothetical protein B0H63DRAFT_475639 [Podospora didyma]|uniref:Uncharacterized protein n=1 Tax=Podospora didyma TaxID=330526 RepID=A0AAE0TVR8_9PEZI|nr:hypothetical protein B0H63DRAFT_475639 [Podospora didyma]
MSLVSRSSSRYSTTSSHHSLSVVYTSCSSSSSPYLTSASPYSIASREGEIITKEEVTAKEEEEKVALHESVAIEGAKEEATNQKEDKVIEKADEEVTITTEEEQEKDGIGTPDGGEGREQEVELSFDEIRQVPLLREKRDMESHGKKKEETEKKGKKLGRHTELVEEDEQELMTTGG